MSTENAVAARHQVLPEPVARRGLDEFVWRTLKNSIYPGASSDSILMAVDYCLAHQYDPLRRAVHLVPMEVKIAGTDRTEWRDVPMIGINALRVDALRSGVYLGHSAPDYGPLIEVKGVKAPEWVQMEFRRLHRETGQTITFTVRTYFREVVATNREGKPNARWSRAPVQMLTKCAEAAGLRESCPDSVGGTYVAEEMEGQRPIDAPPAGETTETPALVMPPQYENWLHDLHAVAENGLDAFAQAWKDASVDQRAYLMATDPDAYEQLKQKATAISAPPSDEPLP